MSQAKTVCWLVRHGETALNAEGRFRSSKNVPLNADGRKAAEELKKYFTKKPIGKVYSSDLRRARQTVDTVLEDKDIKAHFTKDLRSWNLGILAGQKKSAHKDEVLHYEKYPNQRIKGGETLNEFRERSQPVLEEAVTSGTPEAPNLILSHSSLVHELSNMLYGDHNAVKVEPGGIVAITFDGTNYELVPELKESDDPENKHYAS